MITIDKFLHLHRCEYIMGNGRQCRKPARVILANYKRYCRQHLKRMTLAGELPPGVSQLKGKKGVMTAAGPYEGVNKVQAANVADSKSIGEVKKVEDIELTRVLQQGAILRCIEQLAADPRHPGLRTQRIRGRSSWEARIDGSNRLEWEYSRPNEIVLINHCTHDQVLP